MCGYSKDLLNALTLLCCCHREPAINSLTADPIFNIISLLLAGQITYLSCSDLLSVNIILGNASNAYRESFHGIPCISSIQLCKTTHKLAPAAKMGITDRCTLSTNFRLYHVKLSLLQRDEFNIKATVTLLSFPIQVDFVHCQNSPA
jgi:hypothetical protein